MSEADNKDKSENPHEGHRERMRRRFLDEGLDSFADHEVLEYALWALAIAATASVVLNLIASVLFEGAKKLFQ